VPRIALSQNKPKFGKLIIARLCQMEKTQKWLAQSAGINPIYLNAVIAGRAKPSLNLLQKISKHIEIEVADLVRLLPK